ncbi:MAG: deoxyribodipyrimidine photo-lyase [Zetaproteobacteria bacterium]|nr:deoxyribodipyrimidine photo-lyase [Zetaproteobacteria bacterium]
MNSPKTAILWIRRDLRLHDNQALLHSLNFQQVVPCFIWEDTPSTEWRMGAASKWWLHHSLHAFQQSLKKLGSDLVLVKGTPEKKLVELAQHYGASSILWNRSYNPQEAPTIQALMRAAGQQGLEVIACQGNLLCEKSALLKDDGNPYKVYTAFWRKFIKVYTPTCQAKPTQLPALPQAPYTKTATLADLNLLPDIPWDAGFNEYWHPGEEHALTKMRTFLKQGVLRYKSDRDQPHLAGTSMLSPHLQFGEIHPQRILQHIVDTFGPLGQLTDPNIIQFTKEVLWREFSYHLLQHFPHTPNQPLVKAFQHFPYQKNKVWFKAWTKGQTGYPIVDAGMRQLWHTGWMHNRVRMITASFLIKHLGVHWLEGAKWFWDTLVDADLASNTQGWQWTAGCGADAAPFFRIFNPITQGEKFDPQGLYAARWCPELRHLPAKWIYKPWEAPSHELKKAGIHLGTDYPYPIVDHKESRERALSQYEEIKK